MAERGYLLISASAAGAGNEIGGYDSFKGMVFWNHTAYSASANSGSASATLYCSPDPLMGWWPVTGWTMGGASQGSALLTANYGHLMASATWISASGCLTMFAQWGQ